MTLFLFLVKLHDTLTSSSSSSSSSFRNSYGYSVFNFISNDLLSLTREMSSDYYNYHLKHPEKRHEINLDGPFPTTPKDCSAKERDTLSEVLHHMVSEIFVPDQGNNSTTLLHRIKTSVSQYAPHIPSASMNSAQDVLLWTSQGSPLRAIFVASAGMIIFAYLIGFVVSLLLVVSATFHAIVISVLVSVAATGGILALLFACVTTVYIGGLTIAIFAVFTVSFWATVAILTAAGWIGLFCTLWLGTRKSFELAQQFLAVRSSTIGNNADASHPPKIEENKDSN